MLKRRDEHREEQAALTHAANARQRCHEARRNCHS